MTVKVKPTALQVGQPMAFDIAMDTHTVELGDDLTQITILRDVKGNEYERLCGRALAGGHHREGTLKFPPVASEPTHVELVIESQAKVPERTFRWSLTS